MVFVSKSFRLLPNDSFCPLCDRVRRTQRGIGRKPDIHVRQVGEVLGKELRLQHGEKHSAQHQNDQRGSERTPTMSEREVTYPIVERREAVLSSLGHGRFQMLGRFDHVVRNQRHKGERNNDGGDQRARHHNWQAVEEKACIAGQHQEREVGDDVRDGGKYNRFRQFGRSNPGCEIARGAGAQLTLDRIPCHNRHIYQQAERDDQSRDRNLLNINVKNVNDAEGHRQRQGDGSCHQHGGTPVPESNQGDDHDENNGLIETTHQQTDKLLYLPRLVRRASHNKVSRQLRAHVGKGLVDRGAKLENLLPRSHLYGQGDGAVAMPISVRLARDHVVQVPGGGLICTRYVHKIAQIKRRPTRRRCQEHVANILRAFELGGRVNQDISRLGLDDATRSRHIPRVEDVFDLRRLQFQCCQPRVRVLQVNLFRQNAGALDFRYLGYTLQSALDQIGEIIQLPIRIPV